METSSKGRPFSLLVANTPCWSSVTVPAAAARCGAEAVLNLEFVKSPEVSYRFIEQLSALCSGGFTVKLSAHSPFAQQILEGLPERVKTVILSGTESASLSTLAEQARAGRSLLLEVISASATALAGNLGADGIVGKGHEAGGAVGEESTYVLVQRLLAETPLPVYAYGGIGPAAAAACYAAGAAGVILDSQLLLTPEAALPARARDSIESLQGDEFVLLGQEIDLPFRVYSPPGRKLLERFGRLELELANVDDALARRDQWLTRLGTLISQPDSRPAVLPLGLDALVAKYLGHKFHNVSGIVRGIREAALEGCQLARSEQPLRSRSPFADSCGIEFPILQGPMTRVSDSPAFAAAVAQNGGLPFLAVALNRGSKLLDLLKETGELLGNRPWGVGVLGFVDEALRKEQYEAIREVRPRFAIIAGGRPDQALSFEEHGISTYLHVPRPSLLRLFIDQGSRKFIFEGRECGGHVGPLTSFVLWQSVIEVLEEAIASGTPAEEFHAVFAGGIHDARSAAMLSAMTAPLAAKGVRIGTLMGTAYLFTREATETGAIVEGFQQEALKCTGTVTLASGTGHATRSAITPFCDSFRSAKLELVRQNRSAREIRDTLEALNIGRLRIASKGIDRAEPSDTGPKYVAVPPERQREQGLYMIGQVAALRNSTCAMRELHSDVSAGSGRILEQLIEEPPPPAPRSDWSAKPMDIAIVGMGCLLPRAPNPRRFWANILNKVDAIIQVPKERFDVEQYFDPDRNVRDKIYSRMGGFIEEVPFDPMRFGIPPSALSSIDPMQLLALAVVEQALQDSGLGRRGFPKETTSVILGISGGLGPLGVDYAVRSTLPELIEETPEQVLALLPEWTGDSFAGILPNVAAGRVANRFDFGGVNLAVDAACASSLAAVYLGARELATGTSDVAVVGGIDAGQIPFGYLCFSKSQALSPSGKCKTFDASADGIVISDGAAAIVLKRLADAERDGDRVYAVIRGIAGSSDGRGKSMTAPRREGQVLAMRRAWGQAGIETSSIGLIEAHGTGTVAGDKTELASVAEVLGRGGAAPVSCAIGSVKSNIGHTKSAAGIAGLMKVALALYHRVLPPTLNVSQPNPILSEPGNPLFVNTNAAPWVADGTPLRAGVSSFGFGGTNFHAALEEYPNSLLPDTDRAAESEWPAELFALRADSSQEMLATLDQLRGALDDAMPASLRMLAVAACRMASRKRKGNLRLALVASSPDELRERLETARAVVATGGEQVKDPAGVYLARNNRPPGIAFLFPGQGSQHTGMLRDLAVSFPEFQHALQIAELAIGGALGKKLSRLIYPPPAFGAETEAAQRQALTDTVVAQPALGVVEMAFFRLLARLGVRPEVVAGHSYGEYVALCAAGVFPEKDLYSLSEARGRAIKDSVADAPGTMAAVFADGATVAAVLEGATGVAVANLNSPKQTVVSGSSKSIDQATDLLRQAGLGVRPIPVACAFHSPLMQPARDRLAARLAAQKIESPEITVFSNSLAQEYPATPEQIAEILVEHLVRPVRFQEEVNAIYERGIRLFLEVGPKSVLSGLTRQILEGRDALVMEGDHPERHGVVHLLHVLGELFSCGLEIEVEELYRPDLLEPADLAKGKPSAPGWMLNGHGIRRASEDPPMRTRTTLSAAPAAAAAPKASGVREVDAPGGEAQPANFPGSPAPSIMTPPTAPGMPGPAGTSEDLDSVMLGYQRLMTQFLETQTSIMNAYLQGAPAEPESALRPVSQPAATVPSSVTHQPVGALPPLETGPSEQQQPGVSGPEPAEVPEAAPAAPRQRDVRASFMAVVSDKTGYPEEMLDPDASIEADLGIDSIKRVEVLSAFQNGLAGAEQGRVQQVMDRLTAAVTLGEISGLLTEALAGTEPAAVSDRTSGTEAAPRDLLAEIRKVVSEKTGYPVDMLAADADLEADLGVDSIKRVEILSAYQNSLSPGEKQALQGVMDKLTSARTLKEIADQLRVATGNPLQPEHEASAVPCFRLAVEERERPAVQRTGHSGRVWLISDDESGLAAELADSVQRAGENAILLRHDVDAVIDTGGVLTANLTDEASVNRALARVRQSYGSIGVVVHLLPFRRARVPLPETLEAWRRKLQHDVKSEFLLARGAQQELERVGEAGGAMFAVVTARGGDFGQRMASESSPADWAVADFAKSFALELLGVRTRIVDLDPTDPLPILKEKLFDELNCEDGLMQAGLPRDQRLTVVPEAKDYSEESASQIGSDWVVLLTGGARGITAEIAHLIARERKPTLILAGKSALDPEAEPGNLAGIEDPRELRGELARLLSAKLDKVRPTDVESALQRVLKNREIKSNIERLRDMGARVEYYSVDVRDEESFGGLIRRIYEEHRRLDVVIHGAGIIEDKLVKDKTPESLDRVVHTKADAVHILGRYLQGDTLRRLVLMSSITAAFGNRGQADYGAANGVMNGFAMRLATEWPGRVVAMNWGPWDQTGMVSDQVRRQFESRGVQLIPPAEGARAVLREIESGDRGDVLLALGDGPWNRSHAGKSSSIAGASIGTRT